MRRERRDGLPLAAKEMSRLFPSLWATKKAAERWTEKTPQRLRTLLSGVGASELPRSAPGLAPDWHPGQTHARVRAGAEKMRGKKSDDGASTLRRVFRSGGVACHRVRHHIVVAGRLSGLDRRLIWCRTPRANGKSRPTGRMTRLSRFRYPQPPEAATRS